MDNGARLIAHLHALVGTTTSGARSMTVSCGTISTEMFCLINRCQAGLMTLIRIAALSAGSTLIQQNMACRLSLATCMVMGRLLSRLSIQTCFRGHNYWAHFAEQESMGVTAQARRRFTSQWTGVLRNCRKNNKSTKSSKQS